MTSVSAWAAEAPSGSPLAGRAGGRHAAGDILRQQWTAALTIVIWRAHNRTRGADVRPAGCWGGGLEEAGAEGPAWVGRARARGSGASRSSSKFPSGRESVVRLLQGRRLPMGLDRRVWGVWLVTEFKLGFCRRRTVVLCCNAQKGLRTAADRRPTQAAGDGRARQQTASSLAGDAKVTGRCVLDTCDVCARQCLFIIARSPRPPCAQQS